ncbi:CbiX/SirB N-terminal domain-containing protein [uncultured Azonexus sp.]|uniref:sirohydrochlorin chelatase n=1 Tax=uncultured Azonexus sp. TaxID=520307 RepID=UPI00262BD1CC|nr:CbiX/SirB N-terminal domain-containing protein [uncultured Azonexus sp.]
MTTAIILFAHGARDPEWAAPMRRVQAAIRSAAPAMPVELAFLEFMTPDLPTCAAEAIAGGARKVVVLPMFIAQGGHLKREVPEMLAAMQARWPTVEFVLDRAIGEEESVVRAMAEAALRKAGAALA